MKNNFRNRRPKAFLGSLLGAVGGVVGSIVPGIGTALGAAVGSAVGGIGDSLINSNKQRKAASREERAQIYQTRLKSAESLNNSYANTEYQDAFRDRFDFAFGGNVRKDNSKFKPSVKFVDRSPKLQVGGFIR